MKFKNGNWVIVTQRREGFPDREMIGKVVDATRDYAIAECGRGPSAQRFTMSEDTFSIISFRRMTQRDWNRRGC